jgi:hypothetical protein
LRRFPIPSAEHNNRTVGSRRPIELHMTKQLQISYLLAGKTDH